MLLYTDSNTVVNVSLFTRTLDVDFNSLNYRSGRLFIDSDVGCGF
jgi:hypothetical protein